MWMQVDTIYDLIANVLLYNMLHIRKGDICGTEHIPCECILNADQPESFFCSTTYITTCDYIRNRHS